MESMRRTMGKKLNNFIAYGCAQKYIDCFRITKHYNLETYLFLFRCSIYDLRPLIFVLFIIIGLNFLKY